MTWSPSYNGTALTAANGVELQEIRDDSKSEIRMETLLAAGSALRQIRLPGRRVRIDMNVKGTSQANAEARISALRELFRQRESALLVLDSSRELDCYASHAAVVRTLQEPGGLWVKGLAVDFLAESPYWRATSDTTGTDENTVATPTFNLTNAGDAPAYPTWEIANTSGSTLTGGTVIIRNNTAGEEFRLYKFDLADGDTLYLTADGQPYLNDGAAAASKVPQRIDGAPFSIPGNNTAQTIQFESNLGTGGGVDFSAAFRAAYQHFGEMP